MNIEPIKPKQPRRGGRAKGTLNKVTNDDRKFWTSIMKGERKRIKRELAALGSYEYLQTILRMNQFIMPKMTSTDVTAQVGSMTEQQLDEQLNKIFQINGKRAV